MMFKLILGIIASLCLVAGILLYFVFYKPLLTSKENPSPVSFSNNNTGDEFRDDRAAIGIFINGKKIDLTSGNFMNRSKDAYLTPALPEVVILANPEITWETFFKSLPISLNNECIILHSGETYCNGQGGTLQFLVNSEKQTNFLNTKIFDGDRALVTFGQETPEQVSLQMQQVANPLP